MKLKYWILLAIFSFTAILRFYHLGIQSYWMDESFSIAISKAIQQQGYPVVESGMIITRSLAYHYLLAVVGWLSGWQVEALRGLSGLSGVGMVVVSYLFGRRWFGTVVGLLTSLLMATATLEIAWSRQVRMYALFQVMFWLTLYGYYQWRQHRWHWIWPSLGLVLTIGTHELGVYVVLALGFYEVIIWLSRRQFKVLLDSISFVLLVVVAVAISYGVVHLGADVPYVNYWSHYLLFIGRAYGWLLPLAILGLITLEQRYPILTHWLLAIWFGWLLVLSFIVPLVQYRYLLVTFPVILLLAAAGFVWLWQRHWIGKCIVGVSIGVLLWFQQLTLLPQSHYWLESDTPNGSLAYKSFTPQPNFAAAYAVIRAYIALQPDTVVVDAYPTIYQLYMDRWPDYALFVNLTGGTYVTLPVSERYSNVHYLTVDRLQTLRTQYNVLVLVDDFAQYRGDQTMIRLLDEASIVWEEHQRPWSGITLYQLPKY